MVPAMRLSGWALAAMAGCTPATSEAPVTSGTALAPPAAKARFQLLAVGDVGSDTDVCGCKMKKLGGLARRSAVVRRRRAAFDGPTLVVDAGDLFFRRWSIPPRYEAQARRTAALHADALKAWGAVAVAVGERDLAVGIEPLRQLAARGGVELLSANLRMAKSGQPPFPTFTVVSAGEVKVGLVGASPVFTENDPAIQVYEQAGLTSLPLESSVVAAAKAARAAGADWVVGLLHVGQRRALSLLRSLPEQTIDFAVVAHDRAIDELRLVAQARRGYVQAGERGKWLMAIETTIDPHARVLVDEGQVQEAAQIAAQLDVEIQKTSDPQKKARLERRRARMQRQQPLGSVAGHRVHANIIELNELVPEDPEMLTVYRQYQSDLARLADVGVARADLTYVGHRACRSCHAKAYDHWKRSGHAKAWKTMVRTRQTANLDCIGCHVTGFERPGGPRRVSDLKPFRNVGCEACHGPGSAHVEEPTVPVDYIEVPERVCAECHRQQADQKPFVYDERLVKILGPGHGRSSKR